MPKPSKQNFGDLIDMLEKLYNIGEQRDDDEISTHELFKQTKEIISTNLHFTLIKKVDQFNS